MRIQLLNINRSVIAEVFGVTEFPFATEKTISLPNLGQLVVIAGPNGAGKSRLLRLLRDIAPLALSSSQVEKISQEIQKLRKSVDERRKRNLSVSPPVPDPGLDQQIERIELLKRELKKVEVLKWEGDSTRPILYMSPNPDLRSPSERRDDEAKQFAQRMSNMEPEEMEIRPTAYARSVLRAGMRDRDRNRGSDLTSVALGRENLLRALVADLLGDNVELSLDDDHQLTICGRSEYSSLSAGQRMLFKLACQLHAHGDGISNMVLMLDEPENHIHPAALVQVVDRLRGLLSAGQLWVATHSVPLIAHLVAEDPGSLWYSYNETFEYAGRNPTKVMTSLLGGERGVERLASLTRLPAQYATETFLAQCLLKPGVAPYFESDPQTEQIARIVGQLSGRSAQQRKNKLRVLDYGAGKGRLLATIRAARGEVGIDYLAFEPSSDSADDLTREIALAYPGETGRQRYFTSTTDMEAKIDNHSVDAVVLCNVLHELPPQEWRNLFGPDGLLSKLLSEHGMLLLVEDMEIPIGERPHPYGFMILDEPEIRELFQIVEKDREKERYVRASPSDPRYANRLVVQSIHASLLQRFTRGTLVSAMKKRRQTAEEQMRVLISQNDVSGSSGRAYARAAQQYANASLWICDYTEQGSAAA